MSEFSESLQLRSRRTEEAVEMLLRAKAAGYVYPAKDEWVSIAFEPDDLESILGAHEQQLLLHYTYAPDHQLQLDAYRPRMRRQRLLSVNLESGTARFARPALTALGIVDAAAMNRIAKWAKAPDTTRGGARYAVGDAFGFARYRWFSYHYEASAELPDPGRILVRGDGIEPSQRDDEVESLLRALPPTKRGKAPTATRHDDEASDLLRALADLTTLLDERASNGR